ATSTARWLAPARVKAPSQTVSIESPEAASAPPIADSRAFSSASSIGSGQPAASRPSTMTRLAVAAGAAGSVVGAALPAAGASVPDGCVPDWHAASAAASEQASVVRAAGRIDVFPWQEWLRPV